MILSISNNVAWLPIGMIRSRGSERYSEEGNGNPFQYSCLGWAEEPDRLQSMGHRVG